MRVLLLVGAIALTCSTFAQQVELAVPAPQETARAASEQPAPPPSDDLTESMFPHFKSTRFGLSPCF
jgi:hypothetical protein